jgi:hypothetical protein
MISLASSQVPPGTFELLNMLNFNPEKVFTAALSNFSPFDFSREMKVFAEKFAKWAKPWG